jgi:hypothetical protein
MSFNHIQRVEENAFIKRGYAMLEILDFSNNNVSDISPYAFTGLDRMKKLFLGHNNLSVLQQELFEPLINLKELYLQRNKISIIQPETVSPLKKLIHLDMRYNKLTDTDEETFTNLSFLEKLRLTGNVIKTFKPETLNPLKNLQYLELQLFEASHEKEVLPPSKSEVTSCLCKRKSALDWCHEHRVTCFVTCCYPHEDQYDQDSNVCSNLLNAFGKTETVKSRNDSSSGLFWAATITIVVVLLLTITLIILAVAFRKSKAHSGDENCSMVSNLETFRCQANSAEHEGDLDNKQEMKMYSEQNRYLESER